MVYNLTIPGRLPTLNEYIAAERGGGGRYAAATMKKNAQEIVHFCILKDLPNVQIKKPVYMRYKWYVKDKRCDKDNIAFAKKFVQDALVNDRVLKNDGWNDIVCFADKFDIDKVNPRIEVEIEVK